MKQIIIVSLLFISFPSFTKNFPVLGDTNEKQENEIQEDLTLFFNTANTFFQTHISQGKVDYATISSSPEILNKLVNAIGVADLTDASNNTKVAFYINSYNILVIKNVIDHLPISSPMDVKGFFEGQKFLVAGQSFTLNDLEGKKLRPDPRVHFVLVCAAKGCPKILNEAFMPDKVQAQLDLQTKKALNDPEFIKVNDSGKKVLISKIFDWYKEDFLKSNASIKDFINRYKTSAIPSDYAMDFYEYNWQLNKK